MITIRENDLGENYQEKSTKMKAKRASLDKTFY
jgi:hypothetical protein